MTPIHTVCVKPVERQVSVSDSNTDPTYFSKKSLLRENAVLVSRKYNVHDTSNPAPHHFNDTIHRSMVAGLFLLLNSIEQIQQHYIESRHQYSTTPGSRWTTEFHERDVVAFGGTLGSQLLDLWARDLFGPPQYSMLWRKDYSAVPVHPAENRSSFSSGGCYPAKDLPPVLRGYHIRFVPMNSHWRTLYLVISNFVTPLDPQMNGNLKILELSSWKSPYPINFYRHKFP